LRALIFSPDEWRRRLPSDYWEALARLRAMESKLLQGDDSAVRDEMSQIQYRLTEMEAEAGLTLFPPGLPGSGVAPELLQRVQAAVEDGEAYFSFYLAEPESFLWVVTRREFRMFHLAGRHNLAPLVSQFQAAVRQDLPEHVRLGQELYGALFRAVPGDLVASPRWSLALEGELYEVPMAALVISAPPAAPQYLAERHVIRMVSSALLLERRSRTVWDKPFVGVGDPIYNTADDRLPSSRRRGLRRAGEYLAILPRVFAGAKFNGGAELARLAGSGGEISACARAWGGEAGASVLLTGPEASLKGLDRALMTGAAVLHFATHFLPSAASTRQAMIALSLDAQGAPELLGPAEVSRRRLRLGERRGRACRGSDGDDAGLAGRRREVGAGHAVAHSRRSGPAAGIVLHSPGAPAE
jgi:hypothetical protein